jgi:hypothetical protein
VFEPPNEYVASRLISGMTLDNDVAAYTLRVLAVAGAANTAARATAATSRRLMPRICLCIAAS